MEVLPKFVVARLRDGDSAFADAHADAELLAAFAEASLNQRERDSVARHLALCEACRDVLALALPEIDSGKVASVLPKLGAGWFTFPALRWGVLAAGILMVSVIGFEYSRHRSSLETTNLAANGAAPQSQIANLTAQTVVRPQTDIVSRTGPAAPKSESLTSRRATSKPSVPRNSGSAADTLAENRLPENLAGGFDFPDIVKAKDPVPSQAETEVRIPSPNLPLQTSPMMMRRAAPLWAVTAQGALQRSFDAGRTWELISPAAISQSEVLVFSAVFALGSEVWAGAAAGVLYHSADSGNRWTVVPVSDGVARLSEDITALQFTDSKHGTLTTSSASIWVTADEGATWLHQR